METKDANPLILFLFGRSVFLPNVQFWFDLANKIDEETDTDQNQKDWDDRHQGFDEHRPPDDQKDESHNDDHDANDDPQDIRHVITSFEKFS